MATAEQIKLQKTQQRNLEVAGYHVDIINNPTPKAQWYRKVDGWWVAIAALLPADPYHLVRYLRKGFTMTPEPEKIKPVGSVATTVAVEPEVSTHTHRFAKALDSICRIEGCIEVRKVPYKKRT